MNIKSTLNNKNLTTIGHNFNSITSINYDFSSSLKYKNITVIKKNTKSNNLKIQKKKLNKKLELNLEIIKKNTMIEIFKLKQIKFIKNNIKKNIKLKNLNIIYYLFEKENIVLNKSKKKEIIKYLLKIKKNKIKNNTFLKKNIQNSDMNFLDLNQESIEKIQYICSLPDPRY